VSQRTATRRAPCSSRQSRLRRAGSARLRRWPSPAPESGADASRRSVLAFTPARANLTVVGFLSSTRVQPSTSPTSAKACGFVAGPEPGCDWPAHPVPDTRALAAGPGEEHPRFAGLESSQAQSVMPAQAVASKNCFGDSTLGGDHCLAPRRGQSRLLVAWLRGQGEWACSPLGVNAAATSERARSRPGRLTSSRQSRMRLWCPTSFPPLAQPRGSCCSWRRRMACCSTGCFVRPLRFQDPARWMSIGRRDYDRKLSPVFRKRE
jgi:hypothetical protein